MKKVTVIDSIMGSGKTSWTIQELNKHIGRNNYMYITPFLDEVERIRNNASSKIKEPKHNGNGKQNDLQELVKRGEDIASTHALFTDFTYNTMDLIEQSKYTLILDEVLDVLEPVNIKKGTIKILLDAGRIEIVNNMVIWHEKEFDNNLDQTFEYIKRYAMSQRLICIKESFFIWEVPPQIFEIFEEIYILTYMFDASILFNYFKLHGIQYDLKTIKNINGKYKLCDYKRQDVSFYKDLINIYDGKMNDIKNPNGKKTAFSKSWFTSINSKEDIKQLKKNMKNYFHNIQKANSSDILWTTFKDIAKKIDGKGFSYIDLEKKPECKYNTTFISCNCRSTNIYSNRHTLAYCLNCYMHPSIVRYFDEYGIEVDEEKYALSMLLQWIWRSAIRNDEKINIYIPSERMRNLLKNWLDNNI